MSGRDEEPLATAAIWLVTGAQASGKSTVADLLARRFTLGVHVRGGQFYRWALKGWVHVGDADEREARRLLDLRYELSSQVAAGYVAAGFTTVVQDNIYGPDVERWLDRVPGPKHLVVLRPSVEVVERRDAERQRTTGKVAYRGGFTPAINDQHVGGTRTDLGLWLDTSDQTPEETVDEIIERAAEASVGCPRG
ncbi:MAG: AAA family ATPase [Acidimicrobiales bacterium]